MNAFSRSISQMFKGAMKAFQTFPVTIGFALAFALVTMVRIQIDFQQQEAYNLLFNSLHWSFAVGALFGLAAITAAQSRINTKISLLSANLLGVAAAGVTFLSLYLPGGTIPTGARYATVSGLAASRVGVALLVSFLAFIVLAAYPKDQSDFAKSFFMTHKALFIALIYGAVIFGGSSGVAGAVKALIYKQMSMKVFEYIGTLVGFLAFTMFIGYFPDFRKGIIDQKRETAQKQPRFIEILFGYIMIPIVLALTVVLLLWTGITLFSGLNSSFYQLAGIATAYTAGGIWLHVMVTHDETGLAKFYRRVYPITALVILAFEAWALLNQVRKYGLKMDNYSFAIIWFIALVAAILLLILKARAHTPIVAVICALAIVTVLPAVGFQALPVTAQLSRLEKALVSQNILAGDQLVPAATEPDQQVRETITDAVSYLAGAESAKLPAWFDKQLSEGSTFRAKLGFDQTWPTSDSGNIVSPQGYLGTSLLLPNGAIDISEYRWDIRLQPYEGGSKAEAVASVASDKGIYKIYWNTNQDTVGGIPNLKIELDNRLVLEQDMNAYLDQLMNKFPPGSAGPRTVTYQDMSVALESADVKVLLVFNNIDINVDSQQDIINYYLNLKSLYLSEKP
jgi:hypothetical protein